MIRQRGRAQPNRYLLSPLRDFLRTEASGGVLLAVAAAVALLWANSPWSTSYEQFWTTPMSFSVGNRTLHLVLREWVNEGLIAIFFFVVGLEIKRELVRGQLATRRGALLPVVAALGGMAVPALIYLAIAGGSGPKGWAIVVATDIPLALGVLAIAGDRAPGPLRVFLLAIAVVDDIGSLLIIAVFYSAGIGWGWLALAAAVYAIAATAARAGVRYNWCFVVLGCVVWLSLHEGGVSATLAGVAMALLAPSTPRIPAEFVDVEELTDLSTVEAAVMTTDIARGSVSVVEWLQHVLHPWSSYVIIPLFALANTGIALSGDIVRAALHSPITWAIIIGRVIGKPLGILLATNATVATGRGDRPGGAGNRKTVGVASAAGMGFTVALFITELAFSDESQRSSATLGILLAAVIAAASSLTILGPRDTSQLHP